VISILNQAGYFDKGSKVGVIVADNGTGANQRLFNDLWKPELVALHIPVSSFTYTQINSFEQAGGTVSQFSSAVLQFKGAGVNHVVFTPDGGDGLIFFTAAAESQGYRPRYALTTGSTPAGMSDAAGGQGTGALAVSWQVSDLLNLNAPPSSFPAVPPNAARTACIQTYGRYADAHGAPVASFYAWCDALSVLRTALAHTAPSVDGLLSGIQALATSFDPANGWAPAHFGPGHYDGGSAVRVLRWDAKASQWALGPAPAPVP
jgi:ABC-type branched-subunit amino acid transport system substrate-binding protein